jgi:hydroxymethylbilane synthase
MLRDDIRGNVNEGEAMGIALAEKLLAAGAAEILAEVYQTGVDSTADE